MTHAFDPAYFEALDRLLARPDPSDLPPRTHIRRYEGDPDRRATRLPGIMMAWLQQRHLGVDIEEPLGRVTRTPLVQEPSAQSRIRHSPEPLRFPSLKRSRSVAAVAEADDDCGEDLVTGGAVRVAYRSR